MKCYKATICVEEKIVQREMYGNDTKKAIYQAFGCLEDAGITLQELEEIRE